MTTNCFLDKGSHIYPGMPFLERFTRFSRDLVLRLQNSEEMKKSESARTGKKLALNFFIFVKKKNYAHALPSEKEQSK